MKRGKVDPVLGIVHPSEGIYFAINIKDVGVTARMTHSIPSVFCNVNHVGWFEKIIGNDPEPISFAKVPHLSMSEWTVFFVSPNVLRKDPQLLWFTIFSREGLISSCPFSCAKEGKIRYPVFSVSDLGSVSERVIKIDRKIIPFVDICDWVT